MKDVSRWAILFYLTAACAAFCTLSYIFAAFLGIFSLVRLGVFHHLFAFLLIFCSSLLCTFCCCELKRKGQGGAEASSALRVRKSSHQGTRGDSLAGGYDVRRQWRRTFLFLTIVYVFMLICFTLFDPAFGRTGFACLKDWKSMSTEALLARVNFVPFRTVMRFVRTIGTPAVNVRAIVINLIGNLCVFMPLAFLAPAALPKLRRFPAFALSITAFVIFIELSQLILLTGTCDIDDLILNVTGACLLYAVVKIPPVYKVLMP